MPHPAIDKLKQTAVAAVALTDQAVRAAVPVVLRVAREVRDRISPPGAAPDAAPPVVPEESPSVPSPVTPVSTVSPVTPATIAKNVPHRRPVAQAAPTPGPAPDDVPGAKLPPRR